MSHTNQTANYHLPQFIGTDKPAWLVDFNQAMADIDTQMKANETAGATAEADAQSALAGVSSQGSQLSSLQTSVTALETARPLDEAQIETNRQNIATNAQNIVDLDNRMGHTSISGIGDGSATGAIKAIDVKVGDLTDLDTTDKSSIVNAINEVAQGSATTASNVSYNNAVSGLTATNVQDAIDEVAQSSGGLTRIYNDTASTTMGTAVTAAKNTLLALTPAQQLTVRVKVTLGTGTVFYYTLSSMGSANTEAKFVSVQYLKTYNFTVGGANDVTVTDAGSASSADDSSRAVSAFEIYA